MKCKHLFTSIAAAVLVSSVSAFGTSAYDTAILNDHPYAYWPLQETTGPTIVDIAGTNNGTMLISTDPDHSGVGRDNHLTFASSGAVSSDGTSFAMGGPGVLFGEPDDKALYFTNLTGQAVNAQMLVPYNVLMDAKSNFTAEGWVKLPSYPIGYSITNASDQVVLGLEGNSGTSDDGWLFDVLTDGSGATAGRLQGWLAKGARNGWSSSTIVSNYSPGWVYQAITYDVATFKVYQNGTLQATFANPTYSPDTAHTVAFVIGSYNTSYFSGTAANGFQRGRFFHGGVSHVAYYTNVLSSSQILQHYLIATLGAATPPSIGTQPVGQTNYVGYSQTLFVSAGGTTPLLYQWYKDSLPIAGQTNSALSLNNLVLTNAGNYYVTVTNVLGGTNSATASVGVLSLPSNPYQAAVIGQFPRAYYPLHETTGTVAMDVIRTGNNDGTYVTQDTNTPPLLGQPGASSYLGTSVALTAVATNGVVINDSSTMGIVGNISLEAWVLVGDNINRQNIIAHGPNLDGNPSLASDVLGIDEFGEYFVESYQLHRAPEELMAYSPIPPEDLGAWVHLVGTYDGVAWHLYRNGTEVASLVDTNGAIPANGGWAIGGRNNMSVPNNVRNPSLTGSINNVAIYDYALSPQTVLQHYQLGLTGTYVAPPLPMISIQPFGTSVILSWTNGFLQESHSLAGPWIYDDTNTAISPYTVGSTNAATYFRTTTLPPP